MGSKESPACAGPVDRAFAEAFAADWIAAWNSHDLPTILDHYADELEMCSPIIVERMHEPSGILRGKRRVAEYWGSALASMSPPLRFELRRVFAGIGSITIMYESVGRALAAEVLEFDETGRVIRGSAHYAPLE